METAPTAAPGLITVTERHSQIVRSTGADIRIGFERHAFRKSGSSPLSGPLTRLRDGVRRLGLAEDQLAVDHVRTESQGWGVVGAAFAAAFVAFLVWHDPVAAAFLAVIPLVLRLLGVLDWPYKATCTVRVRTADSDQARQVIDLVSGTPHATLSGVGWRFDAEDPTSDWIIRCITRANERARRIAHGLGVEIVGVQGYAERWHTPDGEVEPVLAGGGMEALGPRVRETDRGPEFSTQGEAGVAVTVSYRVDRCRRPEPVLAGDPGSAG